MSWRRGELWLEADLAWFREPPAAARFVPASVPSPGSPPGLVASRLRRAAWKRRRHLRQARATALVLSPAVMLALVTLRNGGQHGLTGTVEDPPTLTFRLGAGTPATAGTTGGVRGGRASLEGAPVLLPAARPRRVQRTVARARAEAVPEVEWRHARSLGLPYRGSLVDGTQLPVDGPDWVTWNPVTDSVPDAPNRLYGNERTIRAIISVTAAYRAAHPEAPRVVVGDVSREGGGPMTDEHVSHQNGLDVDVYFPRRDRTLRAPVAPDQIDYGLAQELVDRFVAAGAQMIFVGESSGLHGPAGVVVPYANHEYHMHIRFPNPGA